MQGAPRLRAFARGALAILFTVSLLTAANAYGDVEEPVRQPAIHRVSIPVADLDRSLTLYSDTLGLEVARVVEHAVGRLDEAEQERPEGSARREAILIAGSTPGQSIALLESGTESSSEAGQPTTVWIEVYNYASVVAEAEALGLEVSPERLMENLDHQPVRERRITDWDGNVIIVYRLDSAELLGGECVSYGQTLRWQAFDDRQVFVTGTEAGSSYLITTRSRCRNILRDVRQIEVASRDGSLCVDGARLNYRSGSLTYNCAIDRIEAVPTCVEAHRRATERRPDWRPLRNTPHDVCGWEKGAQGE